MQLPWRYHSAHRADVRVRADFADVRVPVKSWLNRAPFEANALLRTGAVPGEDRAVALHAARDPPVTFLDLGPWTLAFAALSVFAGGFIKGYSGFGASMFWVTTLSLVLEPREVVPMVLLFEVASSLQLLPSVWRKVDWRSVGWLFVGACIGTPVGTYALASLPADPLRIAIAALVFAGCFLIWRGYSWKGTPGIAATLLVGIAFGLINGSTAIGGPPVVLFYFATPTGVAASRASIVVFFLGTDAVAAASSALHGLIDGRTLARSAAALPLLLVGVFLGSRHFVATNPESFKRFSIILLMALALAVLLRALL